MDTDGFVGKDGHVEFSSCSDLLAHDVAFLVRSLGGTARLHYKHAPKYTHKGEQRVGRPCWRVTVALPSQFNPFRLSRKADAYAGRPKYPPSRAIVKVEPVGKYPMQCIAVDSPDHLFVVDDFIVTHNTVQVLSYLLRRKAIEGPAPALVIAPTSVTHTWENEIARFAPELSTLRLHSGNERAARYEDVPGADVVITSYALARLDAQQLSRFRFRTLILDEAQNAKNPASQIARVVRSLHAEHRLALTGTPVENSLRDLWAIFAFVEPGLLGTETSFRRRFEIPIAENDPKAIGTLRSRLEPFLLRRTKEDVAPELPERTEVVLDCDISPLQRRLYRGVAEAARRDVFSLVDQQGIENATVHVLAALTRLRQICAHPGLLFEEYREDPEASAKFEAFLETVDEILSGGHRLLVFSAFASMLRIMRTALDKRDIPYGYLDGSTKDKDRQTEVARFMRPDGPPLFLCSLKAGGVGLTLTAADYVILYDPWWNPAVERQAIDRTHRIGQHRAVTAYRLVSTGTVEEKIRALAERKASLSRNIIKADGALAKSLSRTDLEMLFADPD
jgi:SNF2 family DNA or RNA helicase